MQKKQQKRLGRGLSSLVSIAEEPQPAPSDQDSGETRSLASAIKISRIRPNAFQPRQDIPPEQLASLAESIKKTGLIQPIIVRQKGPDLYELIAGERRWRACQMVGLSEIPAIIRKASDEQMLEIALVENIFREDLNAIDRAMAYRRYCDEFGLSVEEVASRLVEDRTTVTNYLRLLELPSEVKELVAADKLSMGHARCLLGLKAASDIIQAAKLSLDQGLSVRALEKLVRERVLARESATQPKGANPKAKRPQIRSLEEAFIRALGTKVEIHEARKTGSGKITIHYYTLDDFDRVGERLGIEC